MAATWLAMDLSRTGYLMWSPALRHDVNNSEYAEVREKLQGALRTVSPHVKRIILPGQPPVFGMPHRIAAGPPVRGHAPPPRSLFDAKASKARKLPFEIAANYDTVTHADPGRLLLQFR
jgi:hypothetical protein